MSLKIAAYSLLLAVTGPLLAQAAANEGKVGSVTLALVVTSEVGAFNGDDYKVITETQTEFKDTVQTIAVKRKYSTKEFIQDLVIRYGLQGPASNWSLKYVESSEDDLAGYFLVSKSGQIQCLGTNWDISNDNVAISRYTDEDTPFSVTTGTETSSIIYAGGKEVSGTTVKKFSRTIPTNFTLDPTGHDYLLLAGTASESGSSRFAYTINPATSEQTDTENSYTVGAVSVPNIQGFSIFTDPMLITGSINISALKKVSDVSAYVDAWLEF